MYHSTFFLVHALLAAVAFLGVGVSASAILSPRQRQQQQQHQATTRTANLSAPPSFQATNYDWGCSPGGCSNSFNLSAPAGYLPDAPGFNVVCNGVFIQSGWRRCWLPDGSDLPDTDRVETIWTDGPVRERMYLGASHVFQRADGCWVNATGRTDFVPEKGMSFEFPVTIVETPE